MPDMPRRKTTESDELNVFLFLEEGTQVALGPVPLAPLQSINDASAALHA